MVKNRDGILIDCPRNASECLFHIFNGNLKRSGTLLERRYPIPHIAQASLDFFETSLDSVETAFYFIMVIIIFCKTGLHSINQILNRFRQVLHDTHHIRKCRFKLF